MRRAWSVALLAGVSTGCVYPADDPTGIEASWLFVEVNEADGADSRRARTCEGAGVERVDLHIVDVDTPIRQGSFRYPCEAGFQTPAQFATQASDVFIELHPGDYDLEIRSETGELLAMRTLDVLSRGLTVETFDLRRDPVEWTLDLAGLDACETFSLTLSYADPQATLATPPRDDQGEIVESVVYRTMLSTDRELSVGGEATACDPALAGAHRVQTVDRGAYRLEIVVDDRVCTTTILIDGEAPQTVVDLASLPCTS